MTADRDPEVGAALDVLEPVPPRPGFWAEVEGRLRAEPPAPLLQLARIPGAGPSPQAVRRRRTIAGALAAAAVLVVALVASSLTGDRDRTETTVPPVTNPDTGGPSTSAGQSDGGTGGTGVAVDPAITAVDRWSHAVDNSDAAAGWALLGPHSRDTLGSQAALSDAMGAGGLKDQWGGIDIGSGTDAADIQCLPGDVEGLCLVVVSPPGRPDAPTTALVVERPPSSLTGGAEATVEPFLPGNDLGLIDVGHTVGEDHVKSGQPLPLQVDAGSQVLVYLAGGGANGPVADRDLVRSSSGAITGARFASALWPNGPQPGTYLAAVLVRTADGAVAVEVRELNVTGLG